MSQSHKPSKSSQEWFLNRRKIREFRAREEKERKALLLTAPIDHSNKFRETRGSGPDSTWATKNEDGTEYVEPGEIFNEATLEAEMAKPWHRK